MVQFSFTAQVSVIFEKYIIDAENFPGDGMNDLPIVIHGNSNNVESISEGYIYCFFPHTNNVRVQPEVHKITRAEQPIPLRRVAGNVVISHFYFAYSRFRLPQARIDDINSSLDRQTFRITNVRADGLNRGPRRIRVFDWYGYLEKCANDYYRIASNPDNFNRCSEYLEEEINLNEDAPPESGRIMRGALFSLADSIDAILRSTDRRLFHDYRGRLRNDFESFTNSIINGLNERRSGGEARFFTVTIRLISLLLRDPRANAAFLDYFYEPEQADKLLELIRKCLYSHEEIMHRREKLMLFPAWESIFRNAIPENLNALTRHLRNNTATISSVYNIMGEVPVFLYIACVERFAKQEAGLNIIYIWLAMDLLPRERLLLNGLLVEGGLRSFTKSQALFINNEINISLNAAMRRNAHFGMETSGNGRELLVNMIDLFSDLIPEAISPFFEAHNMLTEVALIATYGQFSTMIPRLLVISGGALSLHTAITSRPETLINTATTRRPELIKHGIAQALIASYVLSYSFRSFRDSNIRAGSAFAASGVAIITSSILVKNVLKEKFMPLFLIRVAAMALHALGNALTISNIFIFLEHCLWGTGRDTVPELAWWPVLPDGQNVDSIANEILITNRPGEGDIMHLNPANDILETYKRNAYMLRLVTESPPLTIRNNRRDREIEDFATHSVIEVMGFLNFIIMIKHIDIKLHLINNNGTRRLLHENKFTVIDDEKNVNNDILPLLAGSGRDLRITSPQRINLAERIEFVVYSAENLPENISRRIKNNPRYIGVSHSEMLAEKQIEITLRYISPDLLPVRLEHFFT